MTDLFWLPILADWGERLDIAKSSDPETAWRLLVQLAKSNLDLTRTERLNRVVGRIFKQGPPGNIVEPVIRLALLGSSTVEHLVSSIRVAGLRRGMWIEVYTPPYGQYFQELANPQSGLYEFSPNVIMFSLDARHLLGAAAGSSDAPGPGPDAALGRLEHIWRLSRSMGANVIQQDALNVFPALVGSNEHRLDGSPRTRTERLNAALMERCDVAGVDVLSLTAATARDGVAAWHDPSVWYRAKQEIKPTAAPAYGEQVARLIGAQFGRSSKCLVLDLDNTLWGGVIGDDGLDGIVLGQGSPAGEAHLELQTYARTLAQRGIILAVCSKNDEANALEPFDKHPEMALRRSDIACFVSNWQDKATNLRAIAKTLNIGLDSLVFVDDNPFERNIVRQELPMVEVPELPDDPSGYVACIAQAGYFEATRITSDDTVRNQQYRENAARVAAIAGVTDLDGYLASLKMELRWRPFDSVGAARISQLINKSNQFNLTTRRYSDAEVQALIGASREVTLQMRLTDTLGDNGMICVIIVRPDPADETIGEIDTWLMSCRVLGRGVEQSALNLLVEEARSRGYSTLRGHYRPTAKNGMVSDHYSRLGFAEEAAPDGVSADSVTVWRLELKDFAPMSNHITTIRD